MQDQRQPSSLHWFFLLYPLFFTGFTHALLVKAGVILVSVKLIRMAYKSNLTTQKIDRELKEMIRTTCQSDAQ